MAVSKVFPNQDVVNGLATVFAGDKIPLSYDNNQRTQHFDNASGTTVVANLYGRFRSVTWPETVLPANSNFAVTSAAGQNATLTLSALPYQRHVLHEIDWGYTGTMISGSGSLKIESPVGTKIFDIDIPNTGPGFFSWDGGLKGAKGESMIITLRAGGPAASGKFNVTQYRTE
jgi:hypothetical protein